MEQESPVKDILETPINPEEPAKEEPEGGEDVLEIKERDNREARRAKKALQAEREANIALAARLEALSEAQKARASAEPSEYLRQIERIYGTDSPEAKEATELLGQALENVEKRAAERALELYREEKRKEEEAVKKEEQMLDSMVEDIEDTFNVDLTSDKSAELRKGFFKMLEKMSPKDSEGNVIHYADLHAVWEEFQTKLQKKTENRAKDLSARSMVNSGVQHQSKLADDASLRFLKEHGII